MFKHPNDMLRKIRLIVLLWYFVLIYIYTMNAQSLFNLEFHKDFGCTGVDMLYEDSSYYYVIGYAQAKDKVEVGVMVNKHDKKRGH
ncbi:MAG: hypothetical protein IPM26_04180 [Saprospiraceae bacterium]|nr:hypothetical protein [Saprospiraceae bacterium]